MAADWIKWMKGLSRRREVLAVARNLGVDRRIVACACMEFWEWADGETTTGHIDDLTTDDIDSHLGITGFASALCTVGWLEIRNGGIQLPRWDRHNNRSAKERALDSSRKAVVRNGHHPPSGSDPDKTRTRTEQNGTLVSSLRNSKKWEFEIPCVRKLHADSLLDASILCAFHRSAANQCPEAVPADEYGLTIVLGCAVHASREKKRSAIGLFRWLISNPKQAKLTGEDLAAAGKMLNDYRKKILQAIEMGIHVNEKVRPLCDEVPA